MNFSLTQYKLPFSGKRGNYGTTVRQFYGKAEYFKLTLRYQVNFSIEIIKAISCGN